MRPLSCQSAVTDDLSRIPYAIVSERGNRFVLCLFCDADNVALPWILPWWSLYLRVFESILSAMSLSRELEVSLLCGKPGHTPCTPLLFVWEVTNMGITFMCQMIRGGTWLEIHDCQVFLVSYLHLLIWSASCSSLPPWINKYIKMDNKRKNCLQWCLWLVSLLNDPKNT